MPFHSHPCVFGGCPPLLLPQNCHGSAMYTLHPSGCFLPGSCPPPPWLHPRVAPPCSHQRHSTPQAPSWAPPWPPHPAGTPPCCSSGTQVSKVSCWLKLLRRFAGRQGQRRISQPWTGLQGLHLGDGWFDVCAGHCLPCLPPGQWKVKEMLWLNIS